MTWLRGRWLPLFVLIAATGLLISTIVWAVNAGPRYGWPAGRMMGPGGMMAPAISGDGPVDSFDDASRAASRLADRWGLAVGEVMQFDNGFYAELVDASGHGATEVLIDPRTGDVQVEWGPAMMWNTAYGMHPVRAGAATVSPEQAKAIADQWLRGNRSGERAADAESFPGYYTLHTLRGDMVAGMLSVHATTGAVWYHNWHGRFIAMREHPETD